MSQEATVAIGNAELYRGDCLDIMPMLEGKVDMILCDLPYGTTTCKWDTVIPFEPLWKEYKRLCRGAIVLFCQQPYTSSLICSNYGMFKYMWYWKKSRPSGFVNAKLKPLKDVEEIAVFSEAMTANNNNNNMLYIPQGLKETNKKWKRPTTYGTGEGVNPTRKSHLLERVIQYEGYPRQILEFQNHNANQQHPTQKPVALMEYLIKTYTHEGMTVLDNTMGSGTTGVACANLGRKFIGIERDEKYFEIACQRIESAYSQYGLAI